jgi:biopolymer transport protein ExbD
MAHLATGDSRAPNVELNIVPFVDVLSCLTAFLLVTAVWIDIARIQLTPRGRAAGEPCLDNECERPRLSVLLDADEIWVGVSRVDDVRKIPRTPAGYDWAALEQALRAQKSSAFFTDATDIEIAAASRAAQPIRYQDLIAAMDIALKTGFLDVGITDPQGLSANLPPLAR